MASVTITHAKVSGKPAGTDPTRVYGTHWDEAHVVAGLENVDNTSDANKPISTATQAALDAKQPLNDSLTALAALSTTGKIYYLSAANTWSQVAFSPLLGFSAGTIIIADAELTALAGLTSAADALPYFTGSGTAGTTTLTSTARTLLDDTSTSAMRTTLGLAIGTDVQAFDADLSALAALSGTNTIYYRSAANTWSPVTFGSVFGFSGGAITITDAELLALAGLTSAADALPYFTGSGTASTTTLTAFARTLLDDTTSTAALATLGGAPSASPTFTGTPVAPTPSADTSTTQLATTAFVVGQQQRAVFRADKGGTNQTGIADATFTQITWPSETYDVGSFFASNGWTPPAGKVCMRFAFQGTATISLGATVVASIYKNGVALANAAFPASSNAFSASVVADDSASGTDVYTTYAYIDVTSGTATVTGLTTQTYFAGNWICP